MTLLVFFAFLSGIVTILSPCILPVLPIVLTGSIGGKSKPFGVVTGFVVSFSLFTLALSALVQTFSLPPDTLRIAAVVIIAGFGLTLALPRLQILFEITVSRLIKNRPSERKGFSGGILTGVSLGLLWTPCVGPIMASVISLAVSSEIDGGAVLIIAAYSSGTALPMFAIMAGGRRLLNRFPGLTARTAGIQRVFGIIMIATALFIGTGADRRFQTYVLNVFPEYGSGLTAFENRDSVTNALNRRTNENPAGQRIWDKPPRNARLENYGPAPPLIAAGPWLNSESSLSMEELRGKVVLIDFWTYSCVNCVRTLPYLRSWYDKYSGHGLEIIGVHSPEFPFERNVNNVREAIGDLQVDWPVVLDNDFAQWKSYNNRYWPAHFFIDANGIIRYFHFGEGSYNESEEVIVKLLREAGYEPEASAGTGETTSLSSGRTPETYLGYERSRGFLSDNPVNDKPEEYRFAETHEPGEWSLSGRWTIRNDFIEIDGAGGLEIRFEARDVFVVIEPLESDSILHIEIDGIPGPDTSDVKGGILKPGESRLYKLAVLSEPSEHVLTLEVQGHLRLYTFTFG